MVDDVQRAADRRAAWERRYVDAVDEIVRVLGQEGIGLQGAEVLDVCTEDGVVALGLVERAGAQVFALGERGCDVDGLREAARRYVGLERLPDRLRFSHRKPHELPLADGSVDVALMWDGLGQAVSPVLLLGEVRRVLRAQRPLVVCLEHAGPSALGGAMTLDELQRSLMAAGFVVARAITRGTSIRMVGEAARYSLGQVGVARAVVVAVGR